MLQDTRILYFLLIDNLNYFEFSVSNHESYFDQLSSMFFPFLPFTITPCLVVAVQSFMEHISMNKNLGNQKEKLI